MKALAFNSGGEFQVELISETPEEREQLINYWSGTDILAVSAEEWRETTDEA